MTGPLDYRMCCQTVTVYRKADDTILRQEIPSCYLRWKDELDYSQTGQQRERKFLLIQPGERQLVFPGDRVMEGIGPEIGVEEWGSFLPALIPGLGEVAYASGYYWQGVFCHTEAGRK